MNKGSTHQYGHRSHTRLALILLAIGLVNAQANSEALRLPAIFTDHAVLQQNAPVPVWGWGNAGEAVSISLAEKTAGTTVGEDGRWRVDLDPMPAGGPHQLTVSSEGRSIALADILIGEVWLASGQSNMQWSIKATEDWEKELEQAENEAIRFAMVFREYHPFPLDDLRGLSPWAVCTGDALANCYNGEGFSAVSYYFAKYLQAELGVPVGIINTSWGGTRIEPWTPPAGFDLVPALAGISAKVIQNTPSSPQFQGALRQAIADAEAWIPQARRALTDQSFPPALPSIPSESGLNNCQAPTTLFNAMVHPLVPYANRGFIWYQGESNNGEGMLYRDKMEALIRGWRASWEQEDLACYFVQLAPYKYGNPRALPEIWEAQTAVIDVPGTGMAVINDIGDVADIHPRNKNDVGKRLAQLALNKTYARKDIVCEGPLLDRFEVEGNALRVHFKHARTLKTRNGASPDWFALGAPDGRFHPARAVIDGASILLTAAEVAAPVAVRFAWDECAEPNLMNEAGLPASAFRAGSIPVDGALRMHVPEAEGLDLVYALDPTNLKVLDDGPVYDVDNRASLSGKRIERIAYFLHLTDKTEKTRWVYAEMDAFTQNLDHVGIPLTEKGAQFQLDTGKLFVRSSESELPAGQLPSGAIELWACNYGPQNGRGLPGADNDHFDFDDTMGIEANPGYGCLQIHDVASRTTLMALNNLRAGKGADVGIGNNPDGHPDWTFAQNAGSLASGKLLVLVRLADE